MWINRQLFDLIVADNQRLQHTANVAHEANGLLVGEHASLKAQKVKDDMTIDWMRHRINALEKERAQLMMKVTGIALPVPEIVPTRPGTISDLPQFDTMPSFEDVGDAEAARLKVTHDANGFLENR